MPPASLSSSMSVCGTSRHFAATQQFGRFRSKADSGQPPARQIYEYTPFCNGPDEVKSPE